MVDYELDERSQTLRISRLGLYGTSIEDFPLCMAAIIDKLIEIKRVPRLIISDVRELEYDFEQTKLLFEVAMAIVKLREKELISMENILMEPRSDQFIPGRYGLLQRILTDLKYDPIQAYRRLLREIRHVRLRMRKLQAGEPIPELAYENNPRLALLSLQHYYAKTLLPMKEILDGCRLMQLGRTARARDRSFYRKVFQPTTRPGFMFTRFSVTPPPGAEPIEHYTVGDTHIEIFRQPGSVRRLYFMTPPEFRLREEEYSILDQARRYLGRHEPRIEELSEPERFRENIYSISLDLLKDIASSQPFKVDELRLKKLADILTRYTAGLGVLELFLADERITDILVNSPIGTLPVFIQHSEHMECQTNIFPSMDDGESWATRFRLQSARPLDEANPVLDTELQVPGGRARVAAITRPLSPDGLAFAFRRFRDKPWTYPLFVRSKMLDSFAAGLLWFIVDGNRTMLIGGTRGSGKTSFLGSCMVQIMPKIRIITTEDTLELPVTQLREIGFNIERLKSRSVITHVETELPAEEALRTALRLGDSALILGEVRSAEALALYEAMRIGALANVVAGTIHGESAEGLFDRVVHDLGVPATSFKATDIIVIANVLRSPDLLRSYRRITEITEVRKHWTSDPSLEGGFMPLMEYSAKEDRLIPSRTLLTGESQVINEIANRVKDWRGNWEAVWDNINLRARVINTLVEASAAKPEIIEASGVVMSNSMFAHFSEEVRQEVGTLDSKQIYDRWYAWLKTKL
jgi:type IV secretory pathway ATPase VirB11/archaellum biosynthesis ATPase